MRLIVTTYVKSTFNLEGNGLYGQSLDKALFAYRHEDRELEGE